LQVFIVESLDKVVRPFEIDSLRELSIILVAEAQRKILVAAKGKQLVSVDQGLETTPAPAA
jgi:hypothetical protein